MVDLNLFNYTKTENFSTKQKIFFTSIYLFSKNGINGVSIREITKIVGIKESSFYNHFKNKDALVNEIINLFIHKFNRNISNEKKIENILSEKSLKKILIFLYVSVFNSLDKKMIEVTKIMIIEEFRNKNVKKALKFIYSKNFRIIKTIFSNLIDKKIIPYCDIDIISLEFIYPLTSFIIETIIREEDGIIHFDIEKISEYLSFFEGLILKGINNSNLKLINDNLVNSLINELIKTENRNLTTKEQIFEIATDLFYEHGFNGVSIRDITKSVGIKESSFYNHYTNKEELINTVINYYKNASLKDLPLFSDEFLLVYIDKIGLENFFWVAHKYNYELRGGKSLTKLTRILVSECLINEKAKEAGLEYFYNLYYDFMERIFNLMIKNKLLKPISTNLITTQYIRTMFTFIFELELTKCKGLDIEKVNQKIKNHIQFFCAMFRYSTD
ncbi:MAG: hypothetical protein A2086_06165 [Spirochaetes bacterium GWD1_27_9]|nr:MAG: hypothetical protein A2Z98_16820 [Spirochaetes bacterium GWB1_27_13]OHD27840.1 MAG: hypothetical protein A2Y34_15560 [Spirochaetes bacterium GWC1_27_15]OHD30852.1 MAG: hypothetical protein A2086_06165 [Spirochaetes bacterium GWD1_27_9]